MEGGVMILSGATTTSTDGVTKIIRKPDGSHVENIKKAVGMGKKSQEKADIYCTTNEITSAKM